MRRRVRKTTVEAWVLGEHYYARVEGITDARTRILPPASLSRLEFVLLIPYKKSSFVVGVLRVERLVVVICSPCRIRTVVFDQEGQDKRRHRKNIIDTTY